MNFGQVKNEIIFQKLINEQNPKAGKNEMAELKSAKGHSMTWNRYHRYSGETT